MLSRILLTLAAIVVVAAPVAAGEGKPAKANKDIIQTAKAAGSFKTLLTALDAAGLTATLRKGGPFTVFAPTDEAFAKLPPETLAAVLADKQWLSSILLYHVVDGTVAAKDVVALTAATTLNGASVSIAVVDGGVVLNGNSNVVTTDVRAKNGVIHVIDQVLLPPAGK